MGGYILLFFDAWKLQLVTFVPLCLVYVVWKVHRSKEFVSFRFMLYLVGLRAYFHELSFLCVAHVILDLFGINTIETSSCITKCFVSWMIVIALCFYCRKCRRFVLETCSKSTHRKIIRSEN